MIGTDYSHADQSAEIGALDVIEQRAEKGEIPASVAHKILDDNPRRFYGLIGDLPEDLPHHQVAASPRLKRAQFAALSSPTFRP
jgi:hypothetical protein